MKDFNNIETEPIPEGLEFNESYMHDAFALYDAEKSKRKRRLIIWWITSALGFSSVLLIGITFFSQDETSGDPRKKVASGKELFVQRFSADSDSAIKNQSTIADNKNLDIQPVTTAAQSQSIATASTVTSTYSKSFSAIKTKTNRKLKIGNHSGRKQNAPGTADRSKSKRSTDDAQNPDDRSISADSESETAIKDETPEVAKIEPDQPVENIDLSVKPAILAFADDSASRLPAYDKPLPLPATENDSRKHHIFLNLGVNTLFGMKELKNRVTFRESIGVSYSYQLNPKWTIGAGLEYHSISRISYKRKIGDTTNSDKTTTILNKTTLNYISFLPQIRYQLYPNHTLNAGFGMEYLLVNPGERYEIDNYTQENPKRTNSKLYYSTFNRFNFSVSLGYTYQFSRFMAVHASYYFGFTDITKNTDFNKTFDRNSRLQIGLNIKLY
jgi:hypothetical protein